MKTIALTLDFAKFVCLYFAWVIGRHVPDPSSILMYCLLVLIFLVINVVDNYLMFRAR